MSEDAPSVRQRVRGVVSGIRAWVGGALSRISKWLNRHRRQLIRGSVTLLLGLVAGGILWLSWQLAGPFATIAYAMLFLVGVSIVPGFVLLFGGGLPGNTAVGKLEFALGQLAFGRGWLVQHHDGWEMHPGRERGGHEEVWIEGAWRQVKDDTNQTILGWQPFGVILNKEEDTLAEARVDARGEVLREKRLGQAATDGGATSVSRGGIEEVDASLTREDGREYWLVDLKRYWSRGLEQMGDIGLIEKVEEVTMRDEAVGGKNETKRIIVGSLVGLVLGVGTGYVVMIGF